MDFFRTVVKWIKFILFIACMGIGIFFTFAMLLEEKGFRIALCVITIVLSIFNCILFFIKLNKDNQLFAFIGSLALLVLYFYLAFTSEANLYGFDAAFTGGGMFLCLTGNAIRKLGAILRGDTF